MWLFFENCWDAFSFRQSVKNTHSQVHVQCRGGNVEKRIPTIPVLWPIHKFVNKNSLFENNTWSVELSSLSEEVSSKLSESLLCSSMIVNRPSSDCRRATSEGCGSDWTWIVGICLDIVNWTRWTTNGNCLLRRQFVVSPKEQRKERSATQEQNNIVDQHVIEEGGGGWKNSKLGIKPSLLCLEDVSFFVWFPINVDNRRRIWRSWNIFQIFCTIQFRKTCWWLLS